MVHEPVHDGEYFTQANVGWLFSKKQLVWSTCDHQKSSLSKKKSIFERWMNFYDRRFRIEKWLEIGKGRILFVKDSVNSRNDCACDKTKRRTERTWQCRIRKVCWIRSRRAKRRHHHHWSRTCPPVWKWNCSVGKEWRGKIEFFAKWKERPVDCNHRRSTFDTWCRCRHGGHAFRSTVCECSFECVQARQTGTHWRLDIQMNDSRSSWKRLHHVSSFVERDTKKSWRNRANVQGLVLRWQRVAESSAGEDCKRKKTRGSQSRRYG